MEPKLPKTFKLKYFINTMMPNRMFWYPSDFTVSITTNCNLLCKMCPRKAYGIGAKNMSLETWKKVVEIAKNKTIHLSGMGETLLHPKIRDFVKFAKKSNIKLKIITNGVLINNYLDLLMDFDSVCFSIDGVESHKKIRNVDFETVFNNLKKLYEVKQKKSKKLHIHTTFTAMKTNIKELPLLLKRINPYIDGYGVGHIGVWTKNMIGEHLHGNKQIKHDLPKEPFSRQCFQPWSCPYISPEGDVFPCCILGDPYTLKKKIIKEYYTGQPVTLDSEKYLIGNIDKDNFKNIWNCEKIIRFRKNLKNVIKVAKNWGSREYLLKRKKNPPFFCWVCPYRMSCGY